MIQAEVHSDDWVSADEAGISEEDVTNAGRPDISVVDAVAQLLARHQTMTDDPADGAADRGPKVSDAVNSSGNAIYTPIPREPE